MNDAPAVLFVACPGEYDALVPEDVAIHRVGGETPEDGSEMAVVVIGPLAPKPTLTAQRLSRRFGGADLVIAASGDRVPELRKLLLTTPYVPVGTRVETDDPQTITTVLAELIAARVGRADAPPSHDRLYSSVVEGTSDAIIGMTLDGTITVWNGGAERLYGYPAEEAVGEDVLMVVPPDRTGEVHGMMAGLMEGQSFALETVRLARGGKEIHVSVTASPVRDRSGQVVGASAIARDISARVRAERALKEQAAQLERARTELADLYEHAPDMYLSVNTRDGTIARANHTLHEKIGCPLGSLIGTPVFQMYHPSAHDVSAEVLRTVRETGSVQNVRMPLLRADGSTIPVLLSITSVRDDEGEVVATRSILRDVSDLAELEARRAAILNAAIDAIVTMNAEGTIVEFNPAAEAMFGLSESDAVGRPLAEVIIPPDMRERHTEGLKRYLAEGETRILGSRLEMNALRSDGTLFPAEVSIVRLSSMEPPVFTGFIRDVTDLREARDELERTIEDLRRSNDDLEQFAYVASHDLQEPLRMVIAYLDLLDRRYAAQLDDDARSYMEFATSGARRMKRLVNDLLGYARVGTRFGEARRCDCGAIVERVLSTLQVAIEDAGAQVRVAPLPSVAGNETLLESLFQNLVENAIKHSGDHVPTVEIGARDDGDVTLFWVRDHGPGFEQTKATRIFQMFQRLEADQAAEGTGIGLALSRKIVERHGGRIWAESAPGEGACFYFTLPSGTVRPNGANVGES